MMTVVRDELSRMIDDALPSSWTGGCLWYGRMACAFAVLLLLGLTGCSSEGGVVGSGISSVQGNVIDVQLDTGSEGEGGGGSGAAGNGVVPVLVSIDDTQLETLTDVDGQFSLDGDFSGTVTVRFKNPNDGESLGTLSLEVAPGATVFLRDVEIRRDLDLADAVMVGAPLQLNLAGTVSETDCANGVVVVVDDTVQRKAFTLRLNAATDLVDSKDNLLGCADLVRGAAVVLEEGILDLEDRSITAVRLVLEPGKRPVLRTEIQVARRGVVLRAECERGSVIYIVDSQLQDLVRVELTPATRLACVNEISCSCNDLRFGKVVEVRGVRRLAHAGTLVAEDVLVKPNPAQVLSRVLTADIADIDCAAMTALIIDVQLADPLLGETPADLPPVEVQLSPETKYLCGNRHPRECACDDLGRRYRVKLEAQIPLNGGPFRVLTVTVVAEPRISVRGEVVAINCHSGRIEIRSGFGKRLLVRISPQTVIHHVNDEMLSCYDLAINRTVSVAGAFLDRPGLALPVILADEIVL
jgi:hypothetical protein